MPQKSKKHSTRHILKVLAFNLFSILTLLLADYFSEEIQTIVEQIWPKAGASAILYLAVLILFPLIIVAHIIYRNRIRWYYTFGLFVLALLGIRALSDGTSMMLPWARSSSSDLPSYDLYTAIGIALILFILAFLTYLASYRLEENLGILRNELDDIKTRKFLSRGGRKIKGIIFFLSPPTFIPEIEDGVCRIWNERKNEFATISTESIRKGIESFDQWSNDNGKFRHNWRQLLTGLSDLNITDLQRIYVICSHGSNVSAPNLKDYKRRIHDSDGYGSHHFSKRLEQFIHLYIPSIKFDTPETETDKGVRFESLDELQQAVEAILTVAGTHGIGNDEILVDITGGTKMASVVGAAMTLQDRALIQYCPTDGTDPLIFDAVRGVAKLST